MGELVIENTLGIFKKYERRWLLEDETSDKKYLAVV